MHFTIKFKGKGASQEGLATSISTLLSEVTAPIIESQCPSIILIAPLFQKDAGSIPFAGWGVRFLEDLIIEECKWIIA